MKIPVRFADTFSRIQLKHVFEGLPDSKMIDSVLARWTLFALSDGKYDLIPVLDALYGLAGILEADEVYRILDYHQPLLNEAVWYDDELLWKTEYDDAIKPVGLPLLESAIIAGDKQGAFSVLKQLLFIADNANAIFEFLLELTLRKPALFVIVHSCYKMWPDLIEKEQNSLILHITDLLGDHQLPDLPNYAEPVDFQYAFTDIPQQNHQQFIHYWQAVNNAGTRKKFIYWGCSADIEDWEKVNWTNDVNMFDIPANPYENELIRSLIPKQIEKWFSTELLIDLNIYRFIRRYVSDHPQFPQMAGFYQHRLQK